MKKLLDIVRRFKLPHETICEVGVNDPAKSQLNEFFGQDTEMKKAILVEPLPRHQAALRQLRRMDPRVTIIPCAIAPRPGLVKLYDLDQSSFLTDLPTSPARANEGFKHGPMIEVLGITFDFIDTGLIDILAVDVEGAEWFVIDHLVSRPRLICLETHRLGHPYVNPFMKQIGNWMELEGYARVAKDEADTLWVAK